MNMIFKSKLKFGLSVAATAILLSSCAKQETAQNTTGDSTAPKTEGKTLVVGFSQIGGENSWRLANTKSIKEEAKNRGVELKFSDAQSKQENQIKAIRSFVAQKVDVIAFSPVVETGWEPVLREAKAAKIPVILTDRIVDVSDPSLFTTFIGSDFVEEGRRAAKWLAKDTGGKAQIAEIQGTVGASPTIDRKKGFEEVLKQYPNMKIIKSQNADFARAKGKEVMESFLKSSQGSQINAIYTHNDDMAMGAIQAMEEAGKKPGTEIKVVSVNAIKEAFQAIIDGKMNATVECSPLLGPPLFDTIEKVRAGKEVPKKIIMEEGVFDKTNAAQTIDSRKY
jgi:ABC-type sugar transport system substrate-binding protein